MTGGFLFGLEPVAASGLADLGALGISVPGITGNKVKEAPGSTRELRAVLCPAAKGKGLGNLNFQCCS